MHSQTLPWLNRSSVQCSSQTSESSAGDTAGQLVAMQQGGCQGPRCFLLPHMCLAVVHEKYWRAILHKDNLIEFHSSKTSASCSRHATPEINMRGALDLSWAAACTPLRLQSTTGQAPAPLHLVVTSTRTGTTPLRCAQPFSQLRVAPELDLGHACTLYPKPPFLHKTLYSHPSRPVSDS